VYLRMAAFINEQVERGDKLMKLETRDFGEIEIDENETITFAGPIFGFEKYRKFVFLYQESVSEHFIWLQSTEDPNLCFILVNPHTISDHYQPVLPGDTVSILGDGDYMCWLMASIREPFETSTVNLKSPVVVNPKLHLAAQFILEGDLPIRHPLFRKEEKSC